MLKCRVSNLKIDIKYKEGKVMSELCFNRYQRGQIWKIVKPYSDAKKAMDDKDNHLQEKTRTWVIMSVNASNDHAPIINCVPMSSRLRDLPCHVKVTMDKCECTVLCEHITTINKSDLSNAEFVGVMTESNMQKIEIALANQLGLSIQVPSAEVLKKFVEKLADMKAKEMRVRNQQVSNDYVLDLVSKLENAFSTSNQPEDNPPTINQEVIDPVIPSEDKEETPVAIVPKIPNVQITVRPAKRNKWTTEAMKQFLDDFNKLSSEEMGSKYGMSMKSLYTSRSRFRGLLDESGQG